MRRSCFRFFHGGRQTSKVTSKISSSSNNFSDTPSSSNKPFLAITAALASGSLASYYLKEKVDKKRLLLEEINENHFNNNLQKRFNKYASIDVYGKGDDEMRMTVYDLFRAILNKPELTDEKLEKLIPENIQWFKENGSPNEVTFSITEY